MITQMKKVSIVLLDQDKQNSLKSLKKLGIMHLSENYGLSEDVKTIEDKLKEIDHVLRYTSGSKIESDIIFDEDILISKISEITGLAKELSEIDEKVMKLKRDLESLEPWGDFSPTDLDLLKQSGIKLTLAEVAKDHFSEIEKNTDFFRISESKTSYFIAIVGKVPEGLAEFISPELGINEINETLVKLEDSRLVKQKELESLSAYDKNLKIYREILEDKAEFEKIKAGMPIDKDFSVLEGWIPAERVENFKISAAKNSWGIAISDPVEGDETPTLLKGNKVTSFIHPLLDFLGNVPGYWEQDVSGYFLIFFTIFFAMIIGDAGYGFIFLALTVIANIKMKKLTNVLGLLYVLSSATVVWGAITGNWFASNIIKGLPPFNGFILTQLDSDREIMELCFNIAVIHLVLARLSAFVKGLKDKNIAGMANLGWLIMTLGLVFLVKNLVISSTDYPVPQFALVAIFIGFVIVLLFGKQEKGQSFFKGIGISLAFSPLTALDSVGEFGNIISYVRLYAVGLAGFAVAQSFNGMAAPLLENGGIGYVGGSLIIIAGHAFNIAMAGLSVLVHGVRLNVLEFSSAADVNWTGKKFSPFREKEII